MKNLKLVQSGDFLGTKCDFYKDELNNVYMTRNQIGEALDYSDSRVAITKIHSRNSDRLDQFSVVAKLLATDGKAYNTVLYNKEGIVEIIKASTQPFKYKSDILDIVGVSEKEKSLILFNNINKLYKQNQLYEILKTTYTREKIKTEVSIGGYRVDFIINDSIVVECDENGHDDRCSWHESKREQYLTDNGYKVIRYNPDSTNHLELFEIIAEINRCLYSKGISNVLKLENSNVSRTNSIEIDGVTFIEYVDCGEIVMILSSSGNYEYLGFADTCDFGELSVENCIEWLYGKLKEWNYA